MKITVIQCPCGLERPHRKLQAEGGPTSRSFFSIAGGEELVTSGLAEGKIEQTPEETAATMQELPWQQ